MKPKTYPTMIRLFVVAFLLCALMTIQTQAAPGDLDPSFGSCGIVSPPSSANNFLQASAVAIRSDGKIITVGFSYDGTNVGFGVARFNTDGSSDAAFGSGGKVITHVGGNGYSVPTAVVIQPDGKIIVAGSSSDYGENSYNFLLARYNSDGSLDSTFGTDGKVLTPFNDAAASAMAIHSDGRIVVAGSINNGIDYSFLVVKYNTNGSLDTSFGAGGKVTTAFGSDSSFASDVVIQSDGRIVAVGTSGNGSIIYNFTLVRYNTDGSLDSTYGSGGKVVTRISGDRNYANAAAIQSDGKIVVAGVLTASSGNIRFALARYLGNQVVTSRTLFDYDGDGRANLSVFRTSNATWYINRNQVEFDSVQFGLPTDKLTPADFDGDGKTDIAVFRDGFWYWLNSSNDTFNAYQFGLASDTPVPADYTGDGRAELAVYRSGFWFTLNLTTNQFQAVQFGNATDKPVPADYDGDGKADHAVARQTDGTCVWYVSGSKQGHYAFQFGTDADKPVPADYDGDAKTDFAVFRPTEGNWYVRLSASSDLRAVHWGLVTDALVPADYDGDGKTDIAVFRNGIWYVRQTTGAINHAYFGLGSDAPTNQVQ